MLKTLMMSTAFLFTAGVAGAQAAPDLNGDGQITIDEWQAYWQSEEHPSPSTDFERSFGPAAAADQGFVAIDEPTVAFVDEPTFAPFEEPIFAAPEVEVNQTGPLSHADIVEDSEMRGDGGEESGLGQDS